MIEVNGIPILADATSILHELKLQLHINGVELLGKIKPTSKNVQFSCPSHGDGQEKKPSCGMSEVPIKRDGRTIPAGTVHCFTCGYTATTPEFVSFCFGKGMDGGVFGYRWLIKNFVSIDIEDRKPITLNLVRGAGKEERIEKFVTEEELAKYRYTHRYMYQRKLTDTIIDYFDVGFDKDTNCLTFPVANRDGNILFIQRRAVKGKFFQNADDTRKSETLYGLDKVVKNIDRIKEVILCESIIDALICWTHKRPAMALMGTGTEQQYKILRDLGIRKYILAMDADKAGMIGDMKLRRHLHTSQLLYRFDSNADIGEMSWDEFEEMGELLM